MDSVASLLARIATLEEALRPFGYAYLSYTAHDHNRRLIGVRNDGTGEHDITVATLEQAWQALQEP